MRSRRPGSGAGRDTSAAGGTGGGVLALQQAAPATSAAGLWIVCLLDYIVLGCAAACPAGREQADSFESAATLAVRTHHAATGLIPFPVCNSHLFHSGFLFLEFFSQYMMFSNYSLFQAKDYARRLVEIKLLRILALAATATLLSRRSWALI